MPYRTRDVVQFLLFAGFLPLLIGIGLPLTTLGQWQEQQAFLARAAYAAGTIVHLEEVEGRRSSSTWRVTVEFSTQEGARVRAADHWMTDRDHRVGQTVSVAYDPDDPRKVVADPRAEPTVPAENVMVNAAIGVPFVLGGLAGIFFTVRWMRRRRWLVERGTRVWATVTGVDTSRNYRVLAEWRDPDSGRMHTFRSAQLRSDPRSCLQQTIGVWFDPRDPSRHLVDTSSLQ